MANTTRPSNEPQVSTPASDDVVLIDGSLGTRSLPMSYFTSQFAPISSSKPLVAGSGISLTTNPVTGAITISAV
jgi:hypothetical protein